MNSKKGQIDPQQNIVVEGARVHNLKNVSVTIPRNSLTVITGLSGSGKSSLAFDTIYAEGQRRYLETLSAYSRQFMGNLERPDVDKITGLSPVVAIEQKTTGRNPRSTVGTITEISDFLRLLFARASVAYSKATGEKMVKFSDKQIVELIEKEFAGQKIAILAPIVKGRKGHYRDLFVTLAKKGYLRARIDGQIQEFEPGLQLDRYKVHNIELVIDRVIIGDTPTDRIEESLQEAMRQGGQTMMVISLDRPDSVRYFSRNLMCPTTGIAYNEPAPHSFSFNSPAGACPQCNGLGYESAMDTEKVIPDMTKSVKKGAIEPLGRYSSSWHYTKIEALLKRYGYTIETPFNEMEDDFIRALINGDSEPLHILSSTGKVALVQWEGIPDYIEQQLESGKKGKKWLSQYMLRKACSKCGGTRLKEDSLYFKVDEKSIAEISDMSILELSKWAETVQERLSNKQRAIARDIFKEITSRLGFLVDVGLGYLSLSRGSATLSGGEAQRIRLATQIGSQLVNVLYIMDEPSIGLHQRDNLKLINSLRQLRDAGNTVVVVEHDEQMIRTADWIIDVGPKAGRRGGEISAAGTLEDVLQEQTYTTDYLTGRREIEIPKTRREPNGKFIELKGCTGNNLKNIDVKFPLGIFLCITGVSGSGKSSLINGTLRPILSRELYDSFDQPLPYQSISGLENIDKMVVVDQAPIGRTPRSNPATYSNVFTDIRSLFEATPDAQIRGYKAGRFSFNVKGGRCEECRGAGVQTIEMNFLPDVYVTCRSCAGNRYNQDTLQVKYKGRNINEVLQMTVNQSVEFFEHIPSIFQKLKAIQDVGLGYLTLGQPCTTLSGGESQRIKLAAELAKRDTGSTLYILDEPTTGLHFEDIRVLLEVLQKLVERGNTVMVIEHNLDVIRSADYIIDIGEEGGHAGGRIVAQGTPEELKEVEPSYTAQYL
ncbi:MAG: excinuclease ABC subunit UvrA [Rikenellaceae bacterium]